MTWADDRSGFMQAYGNRWSGTGWEGDHLLLGFGDRNMDTPYAVYSSSSHVLVTGNAGQEAWSALSVDGGATFGSPLRLDSAAPVPEAGSWWPIPVADGQGNIWIFWEDFSGGSQNAEVVRHSSDHGETFGPLRRLSNGQPPGSHWTGGWWGEPPAAALPGVFLMAYRANRTSAFEETAVNAWDTLDFDRDLAATAEDCDDADPDVRAVPASDGSLRMSRIPAGAQLSWTSQTATAGNGTRYDIVDGSLATAVGRSRLCPGLLPRLGAGRQRLGRCAAAFVSGRSGLLSRPRPQRLRLRRVRRFRPRSRPA